MWMWSLLTKLLLDLQTDIYIYKIIHAPPQKKPVTLYAMPIIKFQHFFCISDNNSFSFSVLKKLVNTSTQSTCDFITELVLYEAYKLNISDNVT